MLWIGSILPWLKFIFLLPGNGKDYEEFSQKKKYTAWVPLCLLHRKLQVPYWKLQSTRSFNSNNHCIIFFFNQLLIVAYYKECFLQTLHSLFDIHNSHGKRTRKFLSQEILPFMGVEYVVDFFSKMLLFLIVTLSCFPRPAYCEHHAKVHDL